MPPRNKPPSSYRGAAGVQEVYFVALLDHEHRVVRRLSPEFASQLEGISAWMRRRDRRARLVRELHFVEIFA